MESFADLNQKYDAVIQVLKLSYDKLPSHLKLCFAHLSIFSKDDNLSTFYVSYMWSALGLLRFPSNSIVKPVDLSSLPEKQSA
ncbi:hypothetical protein RDABS01_015040 [Bienertia sinuspersici]